MLLTFQSIFQVVKRTQVDSGAGLDGVIMEVWLVDCTNECWKLEDAREETNDMESYSFRCRW